MGASRTLPQAPPASESRSKGNDIQLQPTIIPLAWKTVTDSVLNGASTAIRAATDSAAKEQSDGLEGTGPSATDGATEVGISGRPPIVVVCGGKNVGKSTYGRYLVNRLLNRCVCSYVIQNFMCVYEPREHSLRNCFGHFSYFYTLLGEPICIGSGRQGYGQTLPSSSQILVVDGSNVENGSTLQQKRAQASLPQALSRFVGLYFSKHTSRQHGVMARDRVELRRKFRVVRVRIA